MRIVDDRDLYGGLIRLHVLHHASETALYGHWMIEESRRHGYDTGPGTMYPLLHGLERKGYLRAKRERSGSRYRKVYRLTRDG
jgi:DNA-binding PadR family transcriptional regulator